MITNKQVVQYVDHMGKDLTVVNAARVSFGKESKTLTDKDKKLINYLADHEHLSPFEHCTVTILIECPLYIRSQIMRHRTFAYNEISRRYTDENIKFFVPEKFRKQHSTSKQCSAEEMELPKNVATDIDDLLSEAKYVYDDMLAAGVTRELARGVLPQCLMTKFYMTGNLRNWHHFLRLRLDSHAQVEVQQVAQQVEAIIKEKFPVAYGALNEAK